MPRAGGPAPDAGRLRRDHPLAWPGAALVAAGYYMTVKPTVDKSIADLKSKPLRSPRSTLPLNPDS